MFTGDKALLTGRNGQGKTSVLEAVFCLAHAKSFRSSKPAEMISWSAEPKTAVAEGVFETADGEKTVSLEIHEKRRVARINGKPENRASFFYGQVRAIVFTPADLELVKGGPAARRSFLDQILSMTDRRYTEELLNYYQALRSRNALLLGAAKSGVAAKPQLQAEIQAWSRELLKHARIVAAKRRELAARAAGEIAAFYESCAAPTGEQHEKVTAVYQSQLVEHDQLLDEESTTALYAASFERDLHAKTTTIGIHRDELNILIDTGYGWKPARQNASQGQARTIALAMKLAALKYVQETHNEAPLLLLDDLESELDEQRAANLYAILARSGSQIIFTSTSPNLSLKELLKNAVVLVVENGNITG